MNRPGIALTVLLSCIGLSALGMRSANGEPHYDRALFIRAGELAEIYARVAQNASQASYLPYLEYVPLSIDLSNVVFRETDICPTPKPSNAGEFPPTSSCAAEYESWDYDIRADRTDWDYDAQPAVVQAEIVTDDPSRNEMPELTGYDFEYDNCMAGFSRFTITVAPDSEISAIEISAAWLSAQSTIEQVQLWLSQLANSEKQRDLLLAAKDFVLQSGFVTWLSEQVPASFQKLEAASRSLENDPLVPVFFEADWNHADTGDFVGNNPIQQSPTNIGRTLMLKASETLDGVSSSLRQASDFLRSKVIDDRGTTTRRNESSAQR